jgi:glucose-6-phosphate 1-dehydrogenase
MATTIENQTAPVRGQPESTGQRPADVFVIFGITGDLAKVMTFRSLYRLERRGLLQCPIVGVAVNDWTVDQLVERARESIEATGESIDPTIFDRFTARLSYVQGDSATQQLTSGSQKRSRAQTIPSSIWRSHPSCSAQSSRVWPRLT